MTPFLKINLTFDTPKVVKRSSVRSKRSFISLGGNTGLISILSNRCGIRLLQLRGTPSTCHTPEAHVYILSSTWNSEAIFQQLSSKLFCKDFSSLIKANTTGSLNNPHGLYTFRLGLGDVKPTWD